MENNDNTKTERETGIQNWYDNIENLSNTTLHRIIVENKFQPPINEPLVTRTENLISMKISYHMFYQTEMTYDRASCNDACWLEIVFFFPRLVLQIPL